MRSVMVAGAGIAACCCASLLQQRRFEIGFRLQPKPFGPTLLVNESTRRLLEDVFRLSPDSFDRLPTIDRRTVLWGNRPATTLPHFGRVINEANLLTQLWSCLQPGSTIANPDFTIVAEASAAVGSRHEIGMRIATAASARLQDSAANACAIESLPEGWLFLLSTGDGEGSLLAAGASLDRLLSGSRLIAPEVLSLGETNATAACHPGICNPLVGDAWLACGTAAMTFDPICGEGAGHAVREAILASAVVAKMSGSTEIPALAEHYASRLRQGFLRHLMLCHGFYATGGTSDWWREQAATLERGIAWFQQEWANDPPPRFHLVDFDLADLPRTTAT